MKNPIIYKDTLLSFNSLIGKITLIIFIIILSYFFIFYQLDVINSIHNNYYGNFVYGKDILNYGCIILLILFGGLGYYRGIYSITSENSQKTFELVKISSISDQKYIFGKWCAHTIYLSAFLCSTLVFSGTSIFLGGVTIGNIISSYIMLFFCIIYSIIAGIYIGNITKTSKNGYIIGSVFFIIFIILHLYIFNGNSIDILNLDRLISFNQQFYEVLGFIILASLTFYILSIGEIRNIRTQKTSLFHPSAVILILLILGFLYAIDYINFLHISFLLLGLYNIVIFYITAKHNKNNISYYINIFIIFLTALGYGYIIGLDKIFILSLMSFYLITFLVSMIVKISFKSIHNYLQNLLTVIINITLLYSLPKIIEANNDIHFMNIVSIIKSSTHNQLLYKVYESSNFYILYILIGIIVYFCLLKYNKLYFDS